MGAGCICVCIMADVGVEMTTVCLPMLWEGLPELRSLREELRSQNEAWRDVGMEWEYDTLPHQPECRQASNNLAIMASCPLKKKSSQP